MILGPGELPRPADHAVPQHRHPDRLGDDHPVGRRARRAADPGDEVGRGFGRRREGRQAHPLDDHRGHLDDDDRVPPGGEPATARPTTSRTPSPRSARTCRAPSTSRSSPASRSPACRSWSTAPRRPAMTPEDLSWFVDDVVARGLQGVKGVGGVERLGGVAREIRVTLKPDRLLALGITAADVNRQLRLTSADMAGGRGEVGGQEQSIRTLAGARRASTRSARPRSSCRATARSGSTSSRRCPTPPRSPAPSPASTASRWSAFAISRASGASDADGLGRGRQARSRRSTPANPDVRFDLIDTSRRQHGRQLPFGHAWAARGRGARGRRGAAVPARLARDADRRRGAAALGAADLLGDERAGLLAQRRQPARDHAGHRHPGRRRDRRDREHRPPHADGEVALPRRPRGRRRDRARGHRHHGDDHRDLLARVVHGRHRRPVLQAVRPDHRGGRVHVAARGAADHAAARRLFPARPRAGPRARRRRDARLHPARGVVGAAQVHHAGARHRAASPPRSPPRACCRRASCPRRTRPARCSWSSCRRAPRSPTPCAVTDRIVRQDPRRCPR